MSAIPESHVPRKSFAQVAAEANSTIIPKENPTNTSTNDESGGTTTKLSNAALARLSSAPESAIDGSSSGPRSTNTPVSVNSDTDQLNGLLQAVQLQDRHLHSLPADPLSKREYDTKSVASRTTLTLDEKESLRPDDSASMLAQEEDAFSLAGSVVAGSKGDFDTEARAFRDQLNVLENVAPAKLLVQRPSTGEAGPVSLRDGLISFSTPPIASPFTPSEVSGSERPRPAVGIPFIPPDEKLLDALASPKDRLFVLKIEQDMIDFVKDSKEEFLQLPQTNAFYRMLSHKLADYYLLGHIIDESMTSVRIFRTPHCRLPPPLIGSNSAAEGSTPPALLQARKIMRRGGEGVQGDPRLGISRTSSKGALDGLSPIDDPKSLSREERENRYKEARARIFKDFKEDSPENAEVIAKVTEKDVSRSSSASGGKKGKKNKKNKDDEFEPRSAFTGVTPFAPPQTKPTPDGTFYNPYAPYAMGPQQSGMMSPFDPSQQNQPSLQAQYSQQTNSAMNSWASPQPNQGYMMPQNMTGYSGQNFYDNSNGSNGMSSPQNMASQLTPRPANTTLSMQPGSYDDNANLGWQQNYANQFQTQNGIYSTGQYPDSNMMPNPMMYWMNAGFSPQDPQFAAQQAAFSDYNRQQFNPRSQAFVPGMWGAPGQSPHQPPMNSPYMNPSAMSPLSRQAANGQQSPALFNQSNMNVSRTNGQHQQHRPSPAPNARPSPSSTSSISKWGTPSLPPKPPPPAIFSPFIDLPRDPQNQQPLPPNPYNNSNSVKANSNNATRVGVSR